MTNRTVQFLGQGYGNTPVTCNVAFNGATVFNGPVSTLDQESVSVLPADQVVLCSFDIPIATAGSIPVSIEVTSGNLVLLGDIWANYSKLYTPTGNLYTSGPTGFLSIDDGPSDCRANVVINGTAQTTPSPRPSESSGTWYWEVPTGQTITFDAIVVAGTTVAL